jgi:3-phenylpropionate/trans-cinnamate dioxygenase ferredoxin reductase subunit
MTSTILIIGGGQAGSQAVDTLRREGYSGRLVLIGDEPELPYQRPPLSKKYLAGELERERLLLRHRSFYDEHRTELLLGNRAVSLNPAARSVGLADGSELPYDRLLLCLGAHSRRLSCSGSEQPGVLYLRDLADADALRGALRPHARVVIVGGGYIGLETAATCAKLGHPVTVLEMADRVMNRVVAPIVSDYFAKDHHAHGINIDCDMRVTSIERTAWVEGSDSRDGRCDYRVACADGRTYPADLVVVGVGAVATTALAAEAGLACDNGILVDEYCGTSDPAIFAAGDCANQHSAHYGRRVRLESVDNAFEQAKTAALNMLGRRVVHDRIPWFWSDQFDNKLLIVGLSQGADELVQRGDAAAHSFSICYLKDRELLAVEAINHPKDYMAARKLIAEGRHMDLAKLRDPQIALKDAV